MRRFPLPCIAWLILSGLNAAAVADGTIQGYLSARFGMTAKGVLAAIKRDGVALVSQENQEGDMVVLATRERGEELTELVYVLPENKHLALVIEYFPDLTLLRSVESELSAQYGDPLSATAAAQILEKMADELPDGIMETTIWTSQTNGSNRMVRLMRFRDHFAVEYLDTTLLGSAD